MQTTSASLRSRQLEAPDTLRVVLTTFVVVRSTELTGRRLISLIIQPHHQFIIIIIIIIINYDLSNDAQLNGRDFDHRPPHYRSVSTGMGDHLREGIPPQYGVVAAWRSGSVVGLDQRS